MEITEKLYAADLDIGITVYGKTPEEALENGKLAIDLYIQTGNPYAYFKWKEKTSQSGNGDQEVTVTKTVEIDR